MPAKTYMARNSLYSQLPNIFSHIHYPFLFFFCVCVCGGVEFGNLDHCFSKKLLRYLHLSCHFDS